jgi:hypothetical protein
VGALLFGVVVGVKGRRRWPSAVSSCRAARAEGVELASFGKEGLWPSVGGGGRYGAWHVDLRLGCSYLLCVAPHGTATCTAGCRTSTCGLLQRQVGPVEFELTQNFPNANLLDSTKNMPSIAKKLK